MQFGRARIPDEASFDLTPMIDVVLLLIIFFTLTAQFQRTEQKMLDLPRQPGDAGKAVLPAALFIDVDREGRVSVLGEPHTIESLAALVQRERTRLGDLLDIVVRADRACPAAHVNRLAESMLAVGVRHWKLATAREGGPPAGASP